MRRGTTPTHTFTIPFDTSLVEKIRVIYSQNGSVVLTKEEKDAVMEGNTVSFKLTQEDTLALQCEQYVDIQVRVLTPAGDALASEIMRVLVSRCLDDEVIA